MNEAILSCEVGHTSRAQAASKEPLSHKKGFPIQTQLGTQKKEKAKKPTKPLQSERLIPTVSIPASLMKGLGIRQGQCVQVGQKRRMV
jgi:hypothetical protein